MSNIFIEVQGANEHNLKNVSIKVPRNTVSVFTGVSGSGKSSLVYDTIFQEGQRRFAESLSSYARQFLGNMEKPHVEHIEGLSPTVSIDQKSVSRSRRSTVGTITEIYDFYRVLFARLGIPYCVKCGKVVFQLSKEEIIEDIFDKYQEAKVILMAPIVRHRKGEYRKELQDLKDSGYTRARIDGEIRSLDEKIELQRYENHTIEVVMDRLVIKEKDKSRIAESIEKSLKLGKGIMTAMVNDVYVVFSTILGCLDCGTVYQELEPRIFSFNTPWGACESCNGLGEVETFDERLVVPDESKSVEEGALACFGQYDRIPFSSFGIEDMRILAKHYKIDLKKPWSSYTDAQKTILLKGSEEEIRVKKEIDTGRRKIVSDEVRHMRGVLTVLERVHKRAPAPFFNKFIHKHICESCHGNRLNALASAVKFKDLTIHDLVGKTVKHSLAFFEQLDLSEKELLVAKPILKEILERLHFLMKVGLHYLNLNRSASSLSGGEAQRIRLARQVGSRLSGVLYVLDEPSIGLHQRDNKMLISTLKDLRDLDNTVLVIEHDEETMMHADFLVDVGPEAGVLGGEIVASGTPYEVSLEKKSVTGAFISGKDEIATPKDRRSPTKWIELKGASGNNLKSVDVRFPLEVLTVVTGVSGSGKSTLVLETLEPILHQHVYASGSIPEPYKSIAGIEQVDKVINIDQSPIGRTPRSNPATYTKMFDLIRTLFATLPEAKVRGYKPGRFSFNVSGGRCEVCEGNGEMEIEMQFLSNVHVLCEYCQGKKFNDETLEIYYRGKNIFDILNMSIDQAAVFFEKHPKIKRILDTLLSVGLGYLTLGQNSTTLSGGEAQRIKLSSELRKLDTGNTVYILDEPTTGLHFSDIRKLLETLQKLVDKKNTVIIIEHNLDVIKCADYLIDLGPDGGAGGGKIIATGLPEEVAKNKESETGVILKELFSNKRAPLIKNKSKWKASKEKQYLEITKAFENNLKQVSVKIPKNSFTVITGKSGSGKSSLAMDTIFKEGQARYVESLSTYARQFLGKNEKAKVEDIKGLAPAIAVDQKNVSKNPRSTVATSTEIYDYLRLLYARAGDHFCPICDKELEPQPADKVYQKLLSEMEGERGYFLAPLYLPNTKQHYRLLKSEHLPNIIDALKSEGFKRLCIRDQIFELEDKLPKLKDEAVYLVIDRLEVQSKQKKRIAEAIESCYLQGSGSFCFKTKDLKKSLVFSQVSSCVYHDFFVPKEINPRHFSFNSHVGACASCNGLGARMAIDQKLMITNEELQLLEGGLHDVIAATLKRSNSYYQSLFAAFCKMIKIDPMKACFKKISAVQQKKLMNGDSKVLDFVVNKPTGSGVKKVAYQRSFEGLLNMYERMYFESESDGVREKLAGFFKYTTCPDCQGAKLSGFGRSVRFSGLKIHEVCEMSVDHLREFLVKVSLSKNKLIISEQILSEVKTRIEFLYNVGLGYLGLSRGSGTLSGGESQRIRLATQLGNRLQGVLYVLDEPTIGLHQKDTKKLIETLKGMRDLGNTILVVEHDEDVMAEADYILDMGPEAGEKGGEICYFGEAKKIKTSKCLTGKYLSGKMAIDLPSKRRELKEYIDLKGVSTNNLQNIDVAFPLHCLCAITGVSGSGKSSLAIDTLPYALGVTQTDLNQKPVYKSVKGAEKIEGVIFIDQAPIGTTPSSTPATYSGSFDFIRDVYAQLKGSKIRGYKKGRFSFNTGEGRCSACEGKGSVQVKMHFLADIWVECDVCRGKRFNQETLNIDYQGKNIADVLEMSIDDALLHFEKFPKIIKRLQVIADTGLGYLRMGQSASTLSGGEAQRLKLASELSRSSRKNLLYILDEPTTGQHFDDIAKLVKIFHRLVDEGSSVIIVEHNLDVIKNADYIIDMGPEGGLNGGQIIATGTPEELTKIKTSATGAVLKQKLTPNKPVKTKKK